MLKIWPIVGLGLLGLLLAWMITDVIPVEPLKFRAVLIICMGLLGSLVGWKFAIKI
jgi:hypothetical protein